MNIGNAGQELIQSYEQCRLTAFKPTPVDRWTIGWGRANGINEGDTCTQEQADAWFVEDMAWVERCIEEHVKVELNQLQFDALGSLCYNIGCRAFADSTLLKLLNNGDYVAASEQFRRWNRQTGKELPGLTRRRAAEERLFDS